MIFVEILPKIVAFLAVVWTIRRILQFRAGVLSGRVMIPASFSSLLVFTACELLVFIGGFSPLHLLWMWPFSFVLGFILLLVPFTIPVLMFCMFLFSLTGSIQYKEGEDVSLEPDDEHGELKVINVDFQSHSHSRHKREKRRKKARSKKRR